MRPLTLILALAVVVCVSTADAQQPTPAPQSQALVVPPVVLVPQSRVVCMNGRCCAPPAVRVAAPPPGSGYQFTRGFFPWRVRYSAWSR